MTCITDTRCPDLHDGLVSRWLTSWRQARAARREWRDLAQFDTRALRDLGLQRELVDPPHPRDTVASWLGYIPS